MKDEVGSYPVLREMAASLAGELAPLDAPESSRVRAELESLVDALERWREHRPSETERKKVTDRLFAACREAQALVARD